MRTLPISGSVGLSISFTSKQVNHSRLEDYEHPGVKAIASLSQLTSDTDISSAPLIHF